MRTIFISVCLATALIALGNTPSVAYASPQSINYVPLAPIDVPGSELKSTGSTAETECRAPTCFPRYLRTLYNVGIALAGLFAVVSIVRGGFTLMFTDSILKRSEGKGIILRALGGLVIVYSSYILMNLINPALGRDLDLALQFPRVPKTPDTTPLTVVAAAGELEKAISDISKNQEDTKAKAKTLEETAKDLKLEAANTALTPAQKEALLKQAVAAEAEAGATRDYNVTKDTVLKAKANGNVFIANLTLINTLAQAQSELDGLQSSLNAIDGTLTEHLSAITDAGGLTKDPTHAGLYEGWVSELKTQANAAKREMREKLEATFSLFGSWGHEKLRAPIDAIRWGTTW